MSMYITDTHTCMPVVCAAQACVKANTIYIAKLPKWCNLYKELLSSIK